MSDIKTLYDLGIISKTQYDEGVRALSARVTKEPKHPKRRGTRKHPKRRGARKHPKRRVAGARLGTKRKSTKGLKLKPVRRIFNPKTLRFVKEGGIVGKRVLREQKESDRKWEEQNATVEKMHKDIRKRKKRYAQQKFSFRVFLYKKAEEGDIVPKKSRHSFKRDGETYFVIKMMNLTTVTSPADYEMVHTFRDLIGGGKNPEWDPLIDILQEDDEFNRMSEEVRYYVGAVFVDHIATTNIPAGGKKRAGKYDHINLFNFAGKQNGTICSQHTKYDLDKQATEFGELFKLDVKLEYQGNFRANSCFVNLIMQVYHPALEKARKPNGARKFRELTFESLCEILQIPDMQQDLGLTVKDSERFFAKYKLGIDVFDVFERMIYRYRPETLTKHINPQVLRVMVHNNHTYLLNENAKRLQQIKESDLSADMKLVVSNKFNRRVVKEEDQDKKERMCVVFVESLKEVTSHIKTVEKAEGEKIRVRYIHNKPLDNMLSEMVTQKIRTRGLVLQQDRRSDVHGRWDQGQHRARGHHEPERRDDHAHTG